jgi:hypothetical protein
MKNEIKIDLDTERIPHIMISKPSDIPVPDNDDELARWIQVDMATLCEGVCTLIHLADQRGFKKSANSLRDCIKHLENGFADADFESLFVGKMGS